MLIKLTIIGTWYVVDLDVLIQKGTNMKSM